MDLQTLALAIAGFVAPFFVRLIRKTVPAGGFWAVVLTYLVCILVTGIAIVLTGGIKSWEDWVAKASEVFAVATLVYRAFEKYLK